MSKRDKPLEMKSSVADTGMVPVVKVCTLSWVVTKGARHFFTKFLTSSLMPLYQMPRLVVPAEGFFTGQSGIRSHWRPLRVFV